MSKQACVILQSKPCLPRKNTNNSRPQNNSFDVKLGYSDISVHSDMLRETRV